MSQSRSFRLNEESSAILHVIRAAASQAVLIGHALLYLGIYPLDRKIPYIQSLAVSVLFVLSGFLTMYSFLIKQTDTPQYGLKHYFLNRFTRIYSVFLPALAVIAGLDWINLFLHGQRYPFSAAFNGETLWANILMLPNFPCFRSLPFFSHTVFGSGRPLWTLPIEWFCYMLFGLFAYGFQKYRKHLFFWISVFFCAIVPYHNFIWGSGNGLTFTWVVGVFTAAATLFSKNGQLFVLKKQWIFPLTAFFLFLTWKRIQKVHTVFQNLNYLMDYDPMYSVLLGVLLFLVIWMAQHNLLHIRGKLMFKTFSSFSFSLYITHYSIIDLVCRLTPPPPRRGQSILFAAGRPADILQLICVYFLCCF